MRKSDYKPRVYNDGVLFIVEGAKETSSFAAKKNEKTTTDFKKILKLMFEEMSIREEDFEFAEARSRTLNRKVKTPLVKGWTATNEIIIDNMLYSIVNADIDRKNREIYFYLEEVRELVKT